jgi:hypothetical protein
MLPITFLNFAGCTFPAYDVSARKRWGEKLMKAFFLVPIATVLILCTVALSQETKIGNDSEHGRFVGKALNVWGRVSSDGKTFWSDIDSEWTVSNSEILKGMEGKLVRLKCYVDPETNRIKVLWVKRENNQSTYAARSTDSAFRR